MTSNGQRFRRRSLRRGYKVDEVDTFLDRVEATLNGDSIESPVRSQEVHDVVFRVRFGGYDEWQVDLHLDRVERQLADQEGTVGDRFGAARAGGERVAADRMPDRMPDRLGSDPRGGRMGDSMADRMMPPPDRGPAQQLPQGPPLPTRSPMGSGMGNQPGMGGPQPAPAGFQQYDDSTGYVGSRGQMGPGDRGGPPTGPVPPATPGNYGTPQGPPGYDASRHGRMDMTTEMRMPDVRNAPPAAPATPSMPPHERQQPQSMPPNMPPPGHGGGSGMPSGNVPTGPPPGMGGGRPGMSGALAVTPRPVTCSGSTRCGGRSSRAGSAAATTGWRSTACSRASWRPCPAAAPWPWTSANSTRASSTWCPAVTSRPRSIRRSAKYATSFDVIDLESALTTLAALRTVLSAFAHGDFPRLASPARSGPKSGCRLELQNLD